MYTCDQTKIGTNLLMPQGRALHLLWREQSLHPETYNHFPLPSTHKIRSRWQSAQPVLSGLSLAISKGGPISECLHSNITSEIEQNWSSTGDGSVVFNYRVGWLVKRVTEKHLTMLSFAEHRWQTSSMYHQRRMSFTIMK